MAEPVCSPALDSIRPCLPVLESCTIRGIPDIGLAEETVWHLTCPHFRAFGERGDLVDLAAEHTDWTRRRQELSGDLLAAVLAEGVLDADLEREGLA